MVDHLTPEARSANMRQVRSKDTKPELRVRRVLHRAGYRFRLHRKDLPGTPDIVLPRYRIAIFVHGCFFHGHHDCRRAKLPSTRRDFWKAKIASNRARDEAATTALAAFGYQVVTLWECQLKNDDAIVRVVDEITQRGNAIENGKKTEG